MADRTEERGSEVHKSLDDTKTHYNTNAHTRRQGIHCGDWLSRRFRRTEVHVAKEQSALLLLIRRKVNHSRIWGRSTGLVLAVLVLALISLLSTAGPGLSTARGQATPRPNFVVILTDDQRWDTLAPMPHVQADLVDKGVHFANAFNVNPWCCPSRASFLTGQYSHSTDVYRNFPPHGSVSSFDDSSTVATWLHDAGYRTALMGKYLNGYKGAMSSYVPPGWDRWVAVSSGFSGGAYYDYTLSFGGTNQSFGSAPSDYSTDVLASQADAFIRNTASGQPLFLFFTPYAPHGPSTPAPRHADAFSDLPQWRPTSYNESNISDKPAYIRNRPMLDEATNPDALRRDMYRSLLSVDDAVGRIVDALRDTGRLDNTVVVFASDNGYLWGEHRWTDTGKLWAGKIVPYEESIRIPLIVRYDPLTSAARKDTHLVTNLDLAPTVASLADIPAPGIEGHSLIPHLTSPDTSTRDDFLIEHLRDETARDIVPTYCAVRNKRHIYIYYSTGERELYDLRNDPHQLQNLKGASFASTRAALHARLKELCVPPPPGLTLP